MENPLTQADLDRIKLGLAAAEDAGQLIDMAKQAGIDVSQFEGTNKETRDQLLKLKNTFFPGS